MTTKGWRWRDPRPPARAASRWVLRLFGEMGDETGGAGNEDESAHDGGRHLHIGQRRPRRPGTVDRQTPAGDVGIGDGHVFEETQVGTRGDLRRWPVRKGAECADLPDDAPGGRVPARRTMRERMGALPPAGRNWWEQFSGGPGFEISDDRRSRGRTGARSADPGTTVGSGPAGVPVVGEER
jgi:hypothetical protein